MPDIVKLYIGGDLTAAHLIRARCAGSGYRVELLEPERSSGGGDAGIVEGYWLLVRDEDLNAVRMIAGVDQ